MDVAESTTSRKRPAAARQRVTPSLRVVDINSKSVRECEKMLSELLAHAKAGRITGINFSIVTNDRKVMSGRAGVMVHDETLALFSAFRKAIRIASGDAE